MKRFDSTKYAHRWNLELGAWRSGMAWGVACGGSAGGGGMKLRQNEQNPSAFGGSFHFRTEALTREGTCRIFPAYLISSG